MFDHTTVQISKEDVDRLYSVHLVWTNKIPGHTKEQIKRNAEIQSQYRAICHELGAKYGYDPDKFLVTSNGKLIYVNVTFKGK